PRASFSLPPSEGERVGVRGPFARSWSYRQDAPRESLLVLGLFSGYLLFQAACPPMVLETWGIGPRYAAAMVPFLMLGAIFIRRKIELRLFYGLALLSIVINCLTVQDDLQAMYRSFHLWDDHSAVVDPCPSSR